MCTQEVSNEAKRRLLLFSGGLAQLGEHLLCQQGVVGSIPSSSTKKTNTKADLQKSALLLAWKQANRLFFNNS